MTVVGIDVGGTTTRAAAYNGRTSRATRAATAPGGEALAAQLTQMVSALELDSAPTAIGIGIPGQVDLDTGVVRHAVNLGIDEYPIGAEVARRLSVPVVVENDVRVGAIGAFRYLTRTMTELRDLIYVGIGTGISAGIVIDGMIHRGRHGLAGEIGHLVVATDGPECRCGLSGCLEAIVAGPALSARWPGGAAALFEASAAGDLDARPLARQAGAYLASSMHWLAAAYDPDLIVLGGGVGSSGPWLVDHIRESIAEMAGASPFAAALVDPDRIIAIPSDVEVGTLGAAVMARWVLESSGHPEHTLPIGRSEPTREEGKR
ncbi:MAG: ROK family protein [Acidimicrobiia bacterium]|nr:ROK family protein [Acidimicrobiia bacterium]MDH4307085.1 ROK family protein [Acidimicrobiia bacterium]MDH5293281.1 ROK family protein [Acidimicrobiia bacterium]